jgi:hypothetical protein
MNLKQSKIANKFSQGILLNCSPIIFDNKYNLLWTIFPNPIKPNTKKPLKINSASSTQKTHPNKLLTINHSIKPTEIIFSNTINKNNSQTGPIAPINGNWNSNFNLKYKKVNPQKKIGNVFLSSVTSATHQAPNHRQNDCN